MATSPESFSVEHQPRSGRKISGAARRAFGTGALTGFFGVGLAVVVLSHEDVFGPHRDTNFVSAPAVLQPTHAGHRASSAGSSLNVLIIGDGDDGEGVKIKSPQECNALMGTGDYTYLDVRMRDEVEQGAPGDKEWSSVNLPAFKRIDGRIDPDKEAFMKQVASNFPDKSTKIIVGCATGKRSTAAAEWMADEGYTTLINNNEGFVGWRNRGLPWRKAGTNNIY